MFSIILPIDKNRFEQFKHTKRAYDKFPQVKEFIMPTRSYDEAIRYFKKHRLMKDVKLIPYTINKGFNVSKALNIGVRESRFENIIISSPEVKPITPVLEQLATLEGQNVICEVFDQEEDGKIGMSLVNKQFRSDSPAMYFLAMFQKKDIEKINGWDEDFLKGYAYEDNDFGARFMRAGLTFTVNEEIKGLHQYHPRGETIPGGQQINLMKYNDNNEKGIVRPANGLVRETP